MSNSKNFHDNPIKIQISAKPKLKALIERYYFKVFFNEFDIFQMEVLFQNITKSEIIIISKYQTKRRDVSLIISFYNTVIVIKISLIHLLAPLFCNNQKLKLYFLEGAKDIFNQEMRNTNCSFEIQIECDKSMDEEIQNFNEQIYYFKINGIGYEEINPIIKSSITRYLIQESYNKLNEEQIVDFSKDFVIKPQEDKQMKIEKWDADEYVELKILGSGSSSKVRLMYQIENKRLYAIKMPNNIKYESEEYRTREYKNYLQTNYPLLPKLYGIYTCEDKYYLKIQFINGKTLDKLEELGFSFDDKISIVIQLMLIINYLHEKGFVYRDLKPNNIIVDENNTVFVIDFDRMISIKTCNLDKQEHTIDFNTSYMAPEVNYGEITPKNDIYSLGKIIEYIFNNDQLSQYSKICADKNPNNRPSILALIIHFISFYPQKIDIIPVKYTPEIQNSQGFIHVKKDINKSIHYFTLAANQNHPKAQFALGVIYHLGQYITRDINKSIHYYTLAANQNHPKAQFALGLIYEKGEYITRDINKSIHYYTLAANQNLPEAQFNLGLIYEKGEYITRDINKSIHYFTLAANQNYPETQFNLGVIYEEGQYITRDINKSIHYYTLAANQNHPKAQFNLGLIYYFGEYITRDINKSIHYLTLAANQNHPKAHFALGLIYEKGQYITRDINKSIHYYTLAANQNHPKAQFNLGLIYYFGEYITRDINKSIHYFTLAANQNHQKAQFNLGVIYHLGQYITRDINKSIHYYTLAANQNDPEAQNSLGLIYYEGQYITRDINKTIHYLTLAANQNDPEAHFALGVIYESGQYITRDINKSIHYYTLAANQNDHKAQFNLGLIYYLGQYITQDINKTIHYFTLAANQNYPEAQFVLGLIYLIENNTNRGLNLLDKSSSAGDIEANFAIGYLYHEGKYLDRNMSKCIKHYKYASSFNNIYSKNNLGVIYKNGIGDEIPKNIGYAIEYFDETVRRWEDKLSMYNLAHIYIYEFKTNEKIDESIELLIKSSNQNFESSKYLLCIALIKKYNFDFELIQKELTEKSNNLIKPINELIFELNLFEKSHFQQFEKIFETVDYLYDFKFHAVKSNYVLKQQNEKNNGKLKQITPEFYEGFGYDI